MCVYVFLEFKSDLWLAVTFAFSFVFVAVASHFTGHDAQWNRPPGYGWRLYMYKPILKGQLAACWGLGLVQYQLTITYVWTSGVDV